MALRKTFAALRTGSRLALFVLVACTSRSPKPDSSTTASSPPSNWAAPPLNLYLAGRSLANPYVVALTPRQDCFDVKIQSRSKDDELVLSCAEGEYFQSFSAPLDRFERNPAPPSAQLGRKLFPRRGAYWVAEETPRGKNPGLWLTDLTGGGKILLGEYGAEAACSENGEKIAFVSRVPGQAARLVLTDRKASGRLRVDTGDGELAFPVISGDELLWFQRGESRNGWELSRGTLQFAGRSGEFARVVDLRREGVVFDQVFGAPLEMPGERGRFVQAGVYRGRGGLYLIDFAARLDAACVRLLRPVDEPRHVAFSREGHYLAWIERRQILVAPFSATNAPCDGSRTGVEWKRMQIQGVDGR